MTSQNKNFELLDHRLGKLEEAFREVVEYIKHQPKNFDLGNSLKTVAITTAIVTALFTFLDNRYYKRGEHDDERAVLKYRVEQLEKKKATQPVRLIPVPGVVARR